MSSADEVQQAIKNLNNTEVQGQTITVEKVQLMNCIWLCLVDGCYTDFVMSVSIAVICSAVNNVNSKYSVACTVHFVHKLTRSLS